MCVCLCANHIVSFFFSLSLLYFVCEMGINEDIRQLIIRVPRHVHVHALSRKFGRRHH